LSVFAVLGVTLLSMGLALAGAGGSLRVILYLLMRNQTMAVQRVPAPVQAHEPMVNEAMAQETTSVAA
jgi:hypothetical protein